MKKGIGIVIGLFLVLGLAFGFREVIANQHQRHARTEKVAKMDSGSHPKATTSSQSSSAKKPKAKKTTNKSAKTHHDSANKGTSATKSSQSAKPSAASSNRKRAAASSQSPRSKKSAASRNSHHSTKHRVTQKSSSKYTGKAYLKVSGYKKLFYSGNLHITKRTTAFTLLEQTNLKVKYTSSPAIYVSSINGLKENDVKPGSGWMYSVNGKYVDKSAGDKAIKPGDKVHWYFTVNGWSPADH